MILIKKNRYCLQVGLHFIESVLAKPNVEELSDIAQEQQALLNSMSF